MYKFNISAPGTVILHGEHAVKRGKTCVAASLDLRTQLTFSSLPTEAVLIDYIKISFCNIFFTHIPLDAFFQYFFDDDLLPAMTSIPLRTLVINFVSTLEPYINTELFAQNDIQLGLRAFFYLLVLICWAEEINIQSSFVVEITTQLPIEQEGLGNSASFAVCLAACFWRWSLLQKGIVRYEFTDDDLNKIKNYAYTCENMIYGSMSMINTIVSTYGSVVTFKDEMTENLKFLNIPRMNIVLIYLHVDQNTETIQTMLQEKESSLRFYSILDNIDAVSTKSVQVFNEIQERSCNLNQTDAREAQIPLDSCKEILNLIEVNQDLLNSLGVSPPSLDIICTIAQDFSLAGKLTGEDGHAFILLSPDSTKELIDNLLKELRSNNFIAEIASLCCDGVRVE